MSNIVINGATYKDVPSIKVPDENGEMVEFEETSELKGLFEGASDALTLSYVTKLRNYALYNNRYLTILVLPECEELNEYTCYQMPGLTSVIMPVARILLWRTFSICTKLENVYAPLLETIGYASFENCSSLQKLDFQILKKLDTYACSNCTKLEAFVLRSSTLAYLLNTNALASTPIASGTGYIYVPSALVDSYKSATNWSVYANQFRALEDYTVDGTTTGELDESKI